MKKKIIVVAIAIAAALALPAVAMADPAADLITILVKKGVLTPEEGELLMKGHTVEKETAAEKEVPAETKVMAEKKKGDEVITSFKDGIAWESADKEFRMSLNGRVQADYRQFVSPNTTKPNTFDIRRAYFGAKGKFYKNVEFETIFDFAKPSASTSGNTNVMVEYFLNLNYWEQAQLKLGQYKMPMGMEEHGSSRFINFQERSLAMQLVPSFERGIQLHGVPAKGVYYALAVSNGSMTNSGLQNSTESTGNAANHDGKDVIGRLTVNLADQMDNMKDTVIHVGGAFSRGSQDSGGAANLSYSTEARGATFFITKNLVAGSRVNVERNAGEFALASGPVKFTSELVREGLTFGNGAGVSAGDRDLRSWYAAVNWNITGESYAPTYGGGKFNGRLKPNQNFTGPGSGLGAWEVGMRYSKFNASNFTAADVTPTTAIVGTATSATDVRAMTLGLKWILNPHTRFLLNYVKTDFKNATGADVVVSGGTSEKAVTFRGQVDF